MTDIRLYGEDRVTPDEPVAQRLSQALANQTRTPVSVGLSHAYKSTEEHLAVQWLQVNNIHLPPNEPGPSLILFGTNVTTTAPETCSAHHERCLSLSCFRLWLQP